MKNLITCTEVDERETARDVKRGERKCDARMRSRNLPATKSGRERKLK